MRATPTSASGIGCGRPQSALAQVAVFPASIQGGVLDDHLPFRRLGVRSIDLIDFDFPCWHRTCDDLSAVSERSVDAVGETMYELLKEL